MFGSVPRERARLLWMLKRRFRYGLMRPRVRNFPDSRRGQTIRRAFRKISKQGCAAGFYLACAIFKRKLLAEGVTHLIKVAFNLGILAHYANFRYEDYRAKNTQHDPVIDTGWTSPSSVERSGGENEKA